MERWNVMTEPLVSVGLPCYNRPEMLKRAIECITNQTYQNLEIIISNDASSNPLVKPMLDGYAAKDSRIWIYHQPTDLGCYGNYYFVLQQATGKYFMYIQDDDWWELDAIELMVSDMEAHPEQACSIGAVEYIEVSGESWRQFNLKYQSIISFILGERIAFLWMALWRLDILKQFDYTPANIYGKDIIIVAEAILTYPFGTIDKLLYHKTIYHDKEMKNMFEHPFCYFEMYGVMLRRIIKSKYVKDKAILILLVPAIAIGIIRMYLAKLLFLLPLYHPIRTAFRNIFIGV
jgi:glycosyltransferase involved in cell wall biosynthesis